MVLAGLGHFGMVAVGLQVPRVFRLREELARVGPAVRKLFWVYGAFIVLANLGFGAVSLACPGEIAAGRGVGGAFALLVGLYWIARLVVQYAVFTGDGWPEAARGPLARHGLGAAVLLLAAVYLACWARGTLA